MSDIAGSFVSSKGQNQMTYLYSHFPILERKCQYFKPLKEVNMEILLTVREVCSTLKISERTLARYVKKAKIEAIKLGQLRRFRSSDIQTIIKKGI